MTGEKCFIGVKGREGPQTSKNNNIDNDGVGSKEMEVGG
jgi:hypothetical protein